MIFRRVVVERIGIAGAKRGRQAAMDWCAENGYAVQKEFRRVNKGQFQILASRIVRDGQACKWSATPAQLRRTP